MDCRRPAAGVQPTEFADLAALAPCPVADAVTKRNSSGRLMLTTDLRALTIRQPFAWQIMTGEKPIEYRSWKNEYRGLLLIHVSSKVKLSRAEAAEWPAANVYGVILGSVVLDRIEGQEGDYEWCLRDPRPLAEPIRCVGGLGLWKPKEAVLAAIPNLADLLKDAPPTKKRRGPSPNWRQPRPARNPPTNSLPSSSPDARPRPNNPRARWGTPTATIAASVTKCRWG